MKRKEYPGLVSRKFAEKTELRFRAGQKGAKCSKPGFDLCAKKVKFSRKGGKKMFVTRSGQKGAAKCAS